MCKYQKGIVMKERKEYNDRWNSPLVNLPITLGAYEKEREFEAKSLACVFCGEGGIVVIDKNMTICSNCQLNGYGY